MEVKQTKLEGVLVLSPDVYRDERGSFFETYNDFKFRAFGMPSALDFVQDNQSESHKGVLRGLHFQRDPNSQGKLVRVVKGSVLDIVVDLRKRSPTFGSYHVQIIDERTFLWVPKGFAHGFLSLEDNTIFCYKVTAPYTPSLQSGIRWNDPNLNLPWGIENPIVSEKDKELPNFNPDLDYFS